MSVTTYKNLQVRYEYYSCEQEEAAGNIVMLHSLGLALEEFDSFLSFFLPSYNVLCYDMLGHGQSEIPSEPITVDALVDQMEYMTQLFFNKQFYVVAGPGMGYIATRFCRLHDNTVLGLVMISPQPAYLTLDEKQYLVSQIDTKLANGYDAYKAFLLSHFTINQEPSLISHLEAQLNLTTEGVHFGLIYSFLSEDFGSDFDYIFAPILILAGAQDTLFPSSGYGMSANYMGAQLKMISNAAHLVAVDNPKESADAVLGFIEGIGSEETVETGFIVRNEEIGNKKFRELNKSKKESTNTLNVSLMHTFRIQVGELEVTQGWNTRKVKSLFLYLLFHGTVTREEIIDVFWSDLPINRARNQLRMNLYFLKSLLNQGETEFLYKDREHIFLQNSIQCDAIDYVISLREVYARLLRGDLELTDAQRVLEISPTKLMSHVYDDWYLQMSQIIEKQFIELCNWTSESLYGLQRKKEAAVYEQMIEKFY